jgi:hypothetical protein
MDTNVVGRDITGYISSRSDSPTTLRVSRIFVRDLTPASNGNGIGIGHGGLHLSGLVKALNLQYTYMDALTSLGLIPAKIPIYFDNDREAIQAAVVSWPRRTQRSSDWCELRTSSTSGRFLASEYCVFAANGRAGVTTAGTARDIQVDAGGNLLEI